MNSTKSEFQKPRVRWTQEEKDVLEESWGQVSYVAIAKKLGRTPEAVRVQAIRLGYSSFQLSCDGMSVNELAEVLQVDYKKVRRWINNKGLPSFKIRITKKQSKIMINLDSFWKWLKKNQDLVDFSRVEKGLLGAEPSWLEDKRKADYYNRDKYRKNKKWTSAEEQKLISLVNQFKYTYKEVSELLGRSEAFINQKLIDLDVKARPLKQDRKSWLKDDDELLLKLYLEGVTTRDIAKKLDRSQTSIKGRIQKLKRKQL